MEQIQNLIDTQALKALVSFKDKLPPVRKYDDKVTNLIIKQNRKQFNKSLTNTK